MFQSHWWRQVAAVAPPAVPEVELMLKKNNKKHPDRWIYEIQDLYCHVRNEYMGAVPGDEILKSLKYV